MVLKELRIFGPTLRSGQSFLTPYSQEKKSRWGGNKKHSCLKDEAVDGESGVLPCPACAIPACRLYFFRISRAFSFLISLASSPISLQYSLNLSSES